MFIVPISQIGSLDELAKVQKTQSQIADNQSPFQDLLNNAINDVKETQNAVDAEVQKLATGQADSLHDIGIANAKASLSVDLLVQVRNKALDAYNEIMRMGL